QVLALCRRDAVALAPAEAIEIALQVTDALTYLHDLRDAEGVPLELIHRDVTPSNILLRTDGHVKLADFGIARTSHSDKRVTGVLKGNVSYSAPEQIRCAPYDHRVDLYSLGVVLYEMLGGTRPFEGDSEGAIFFKILKGELDLER